MDAKFEFGIEIRPWNKSIGWESDQGCVFSRGVGGFITRNGCALRSSKKLDINALINER